MVGFGVSLSLFTLNSYAAQPRTPASLVAVVPININKLLKIIMFFQLFGTFTFGLTAHFFMAQPTCTAYSFCFEFWLTAFVLCLSDAEV